MKQNSLIKQQKAFAESYRLRAKHLKEGHPDKELERELLLAKAKLCELKARDLIRAAKDQSNRNSLGITQSFVSWLKSKLKSS